MTEHESVEQKEETYSPLSKCRKEKACFEALRKKLLEKSLELSEGIFLTSSQWKMFYRLQMSLPYFPNPQPRHITDQEAEAILGIKGVHNYSIADLAFIFQRSKASIFECLKKHGVESECPT